MLGGAHVHVASQNHPGLLLLSSGKSALFFGLLQRGSAALFCYI